MKINRTVTVGSVAATVEIELTPAELAQAYEEQEHLYDVQNARNHLSSGIYDDDDNEIIFTDDEIDDIAWNVRHDMNKHDVSFDYAIGDAINSALADRE